MSPSEPIWDVGSNRTSTLLSYSFASGLKDSPTPGIKSSTVFFRSLLSATFTKISLEIEIGLGVIFSSSSITSLTKISIESSSSINFK